MDQMTAVRLLARLGVGPGDLHRVQQTPYPQSVVLMDDLKARVKASFKKLAFELHPDRTGNDPAKTEEFKGLAQVASDFEKFTVQPVRRPPPPPPQQTVSFVFVRQQVPAYNPSPFRTPSQTINHWHFVHMKP